MSNNKWIPNKSRSDLKKHYNPNVSSDDKDILELQKKILKLTPKQFIHKDNENTQSLSPTKHFSVDVDVEKCGSGNIIQNGPFAIHPNSNTSRKKVHDTNDIEVNKKYEEEFPSDKEDKVFYIRKIFLQEIGKAKDYTLVKQYTITTETIMKAIEEQSKENTEECDKGLDIISRNWHGQFKKISLSYYDEEVNTVMRLWGHWCNIFTVFRSTPLMYKCYICNKGWWRLHPFKEHVKEHRDPVLKLRIETIFHELNIIAVTEHDNKIKNVVMDSNCWKCGENATFHRYNFSVKNYKCSGCNKHMHTCTRLKEHERMCIKTKKIYCMKASEGFTCTICSIYCVNENLLDAHMIDWHLVRSDEPVVMKAIVCKLCGDRFIMQNFHDCSAKFQLYKCDDCYRRLPSYTYRQIHMDLYRGHLIKCTECGESLSQCLVPGHYVKHSKNYCFLYMCCNCDTEMLFTDEKTCVNHMKNHGKIKLWPGRMLLPKKCLNTEFLKCEKTFCIPDVQLVNFLIGLEYSKFLPIDMETTCLRKKIQCNTHLFTSRNIRADDVLTLNDDDEVKLIESEINYKNIGDKKFVINVKKAQPDEEIMKDLEVEATISKVFKSSKSYRVLKKKEALEKKLKEKRLVKKESKTKVLKEKESLKNELLEKGYIKKELMDIEKQDYMYEDDLVILDNVVENVTIVTDSESEGTTENNNLTKMNYDSITVKQELEFICSTNVGLDTCIKKETDFEAKDIVVECYSSDCVQNLSLDTSTIVKEEVINRHTLEVGPEIFIQQKVKLEPLEDLTEEVHKEQHNMPKIIVKNEIITKTESENQFYKCKECDYRGELNQYIGHVTTECLGTEFNCGSCNNCDRFNNMSHYLEHLTVHNIQPLSCPDCEVQQKSKDELYAHVISHIYALFNDAKTEPQELSLYYCKKCANSVQLKHFFKHWQWHSNAQHSDSTYKGNSSASTSDGNQEMNISKESLSPELVEKVLSILQAIKHEHQTRECDICFKYIPRWNEHKQHLIDHLLSEEINRQKEENIKILKCYFCDKGFKIAYHHFWKLHMWEHSNLTVHKCQVCGKCFSDSSDLTKHKKVHNLLSCICDLCGKKFNRKSHLVHHLKLHKSMVHCSLCTKKFNTEKLKEQHIRLKHINKKDKECLFCGKSYGRAHTMREHMKLKHKDYFKTERNGEVIKKEEEQNESN